MPKRPNPFGDFSPLQVKTHIGKKEVDLGVNQDQNMQTVYDKTKDLLFQGSRKSCHPCKSELDTEWTDLGREALLAQPLNGQLRIDSDGSLCGASSQPLATGFQFSMTFTAGHPSNKSEAMEMDTTGSDEPFNNNNTLVLPYPPPGQMTIDSSGKLCSRLKASSQTTRAVGDFHVCQSCNHPSNMRARTCSFCDKITCSNCLQLCNNCEGLFCRVCSTTNYDACMERILCLHCSG